MYTGNAELVNWIGVASAWLRIGEVLDLLIKG